MSAPFSGKGIVSPVENRSDISRAWLHYLKVTAPAVGTGLHCRNFRENFPDLQEPIETRFRETVPNLLNELAERRLLEKPVEWPHEAPRIGSPQLGILRSAPKGAKGWRFENGKVTALKAKGKVREERFCYDIAGLTKFSTEDPNPVAAFEEHPDKPGSVATLGGERNLGIGRHSQSFGRTS